MPITGSESGALGLGLLTPAPPAPPQGCAAHPWMSFRRRRPGAAPVSSPGCAATPWHVARRRRSGPAPATSTAPCTVPPWFLILRTRYHLRPSVQALPTDFWVAFVAWFNADPVLVPAFPGGLVNHNAAPRQAVPYARIAVIDPLDPLSAEDWPMQTVLSAYATSEEEATRLVRLIATRLDSPIRPPLVYQGWVEASRHTSGRFSSSVVGNDRSTGDPLWRADTPFDFIVTAAAPAVPEALAWS